MTTTPLLKKIDIFISSPGDVHPERNTVKWAIELLNRALFISEGYLLFPLAYEELVPPEMGEPAQIIIDRYMHEPDQCYMLICVLWTRMGTPFTHPRTNQAYQSGTEYEFTKAYEANKRTGKPLVLLYRRELREEDIQDLEQNRRVEAFFERFASSDRGFVGLYQLYCSLDEFRDLVVRHIAEIIRLHPPEATVGVERPAMIEEERRLDAAIPDAARVGQPTELWVQLCVPDSPGFRGDLPEERVSEFELSQKDIDELSLGVAFPLDAETGLPTPTVLSVEVVGPDFDIPTEQMAFEVGHGRDGPRLLFSIVPKNERARSIVHVHVKQMMPEGVEVLVASAALYTRIVTAATTNPIWSVIRRPLRTLQTTLYSRAALLDLEHEKTAMLHANWQDYRRIMDAPVSDEIAHLMAKLTWWGSWEEEPAAAAALKDLGEMALAACFQALRNDRNEWGAIRTLKELGAPALPLLVVALEDRDAIMRRNAVYALGRIGGALAVEPLLVALRDSEIIVRSAAASALKDLGREAGPRAVEPLITALKDEDANVKSNAALALGSIGDSRAVGALMSSLFNENVRVRVDSSHALYCIGDTAVQAIRAAGIEVVEALVSIEEAEGGIWASNGWLLKAIGEPAVEPLITALGRCRNKRDYPFHRITGVLRSIGTPSALAALPDDLR